MYQEARHIVQAMEGFNFSKAPFKWCRDLRFLDVHPDTHRKVVPDIENARAMITLFIDTDFVKSKQGAKFKDSLLLDQTERAHRGPLKIRSGTSNQYREKSFWADWEDIRKRKPNGFKNFPLKWDITVRPMIAKLYKAGVIASAHTPYPVGQAIAGTEPGRDPDLYFDFRPMASDISFPRSTEQDIPSKAQLLLSARNYAKAHRNARFALLRLWSAPHFYPLMLGIDRRNAMSFFDLAGRAWEWKFIPKVRLFQFPTPLPPSYLDYTY